MKKSPSLLTRRSLVAGIVASATAPLCVPSRVLGLGGAVSPSNQISLGVIGVGRQGQVDMQAFMNHDDVRVTALCDVNERNLAAARGILAQKYGGAHVRSFADFRELNLDISVDAVLMALPVHWHSIPSTDAILKGKHIYHEKPMALSFAESRHVREAVRRSRVTFQFGTQQRSDLKFRWACELVRNGRIGKLQEIQVGVEGGIQTEVFPVQKIPAYIQWDQWIGPAPESHFSSKKLDRRYHENITDFSLGMISCWGIHHLDIAQWGNGTDDTGPVSVEGQGTYPASGTCNAVQTWKVRYEYANAAPITFASEGEEISHGIKFIGDAGWIQVKRGKIGASDEKLLLDPQNKEGTMPVKLPVSTDHTRNFLDAIKTRSTPICGIETAVRSDTLCQLASIALRSRRKLAWDPVSESFGTDTKAARLLEARPFRGDWKLPAIS
jgi:predicted dehydrogenase